MLEAADVISIDCIHAMSVLTTPDIVVHDQDPVKDLGEPAHIAHGVTITTGKWPDLSGSGDDGLAWQSGPQLLKENEEIGRVAG